MIFLLFCEQSLKFMSSDIEYVSDRLFVGGYYGRLHSNFYFRCHNEHCPFSVLLLVEIVAGVYVASSTKKVVRPVHNLENSTLSKAQIKKTS